MHQQSEIEETLERIKNHKGVEGYVIVDEVNGEVLRRYPGMAAEQADEYARQVKKLNLKAAHVIRDLDPSDSMAYLRIRCQKHELLVAPGATYNVIVIQLIYCVPLCILVSTSCLYLSISCLSIYFKSCA